jgi:hypothetical protein
MKWNANIQTNFRHETKFRLFGQLFGDSKVAQDLPFQGNKLELIANAPPGGMDQ